MKSAPASKHKVSSSRARRRAPRALHADLKTYQAKRNFKVTAEPAGRVAQKKETGLRFVIQKHDASHLHYDFRLELNGVLKSWAVPRGPSLDPARKALAIEVEDHPLEYGSFEGIIPEGQYGGGTVLLWDRGTWEPLGDPALGYETGKLHFTLHGQKLQGQWNLVRMHPRPGEKKRQWLLMKINDEYASKTRDILADAPGSVKTRRSLAQIAGDRSDTWQSHRNGKAHAKPPTAPWPAGIAPQLAVLSEHPPAGNDWLHEIKFDGYRLLAFIQNGEVKLLTRNDQDWTARFPAIARALAPLKADSAILDGEVVILDSRGHSDFQALQNLLKGQQKATPIFYTFDLLFHDGRDLRPVPLLERKAELEKLLGQSKLSAAIRYSDHVRGDGAAVAKKACAMHLEGIISKRADAPYVSRRDASWLKSKCDQRQEMIIVGYSDPEGSRRGFGSLLLGYHDAKDRLIYAGRVGTGFDSKTLRSLHGELEKLTEENTSLDDEPPVRERRHAHWVRPKLVAEIRFSNWTRDGRLRHPAFIALRQDKPAAQITREEPINPHQTAPVSRNGRKSTPPKSPRKVRQTPPSATLSDLRLTHPDKILYADQKITKQNLIDYYQLVHLLMLPHIVDRPLTLLRCPQGTAGKCFFQRNWADNLPPAIDRLHQGGNKDTQIVIHDLNGLLSLVQMNVLEIHTWNCTRKDLDHPDQLIFDLDPGPGVSWQQIVAGARALKAALEELKLPTFLKTSGGKGLHLVIPIQPNVEWTPAKSFCQQVAQALVTQSDLFVANMRKDLRYGKIYIDFQRNSQTATAVAPYSTRARPGAAVSMPITWKDLATFKSADQFTLSNAASYLAKRKTDPWADFDRARVDLRRIAAGK